MKKFSFHIHSSIYFLIFLWQKVSTTHNRALLYYILFFHFGQDFLLSSSLLPSASNAFFGVFFKKHIVDKRWPPIFMIFWKVFYHCCFITKSTYNKRQQHVLGLNHVSVIACHGIVSHEMQEEKLLPHSMGIIPVVFVHVFLGNVARTSREGILP